MTDVAGPAETPSRSRPVGVLVLAVLLFVGIAALGLRTWMTSSTPETCSSIGIGPPVVTAVDTDQRLLEGASSPQEALEASWSSVTTYFASNSSPAAGSPTPGDFRLHDGDHPRFERSTEDGHQVVVVTRTDGRWFVTELRACSSA